MSVIFPSGEFRTKVEYPLVPSRLNMGSSILKSTTTTLSLTPAMLPSMTNELSFDPPQDMTAMTRKNKGKYSS